MDLKDYISFLRKDKGLSQRELARKAQISHTEISRIEKGERDRPSPAVLKKLAPILGVRAEQLMEAAGYIGSNSQGSQTEASLVQHQGEYSYRLGGDELPILSKNSGSESTYLNLKSLYNLDFALWVADNSLTSVGLYKGDLALCSRDIAVAGTRVMVVESIGRDKLELALVLNKGADYLQVCETGLDYCEIVGDKIHPIGRVVAVLRGMEGEPKNNNESPEEWLEAINIAIKLGFTPAQVIWIIKKQAQFLKIFKKQA